MTISVRKIKDLIESLKELKKYYPEDFGEDLDRELEALEDALEKAKDEQATRGLMIWLWHFARIEKITRDLGEKNKIDDNFLAIVEKIIRLAQELRQEAEVRAKTEAEVKDHKRRFNSLYPPTCPNSDQGDSGLYPMSLEAWRGINFPSESEGGSSRGGLKNRPKPH